MSRACTVKVPFQTIGNRQVLTMQQLQEQPWLAEFVQRFQNCFRWDDIGNWMIYEPPDE